MVQKVNGKRTAFIHFSNQRPLKALHNITSHSPFHAHIHNYESTTQGDSQLVGSGQGEASHSGTPQSGHRTRNLQVTSQPALPPEPHAAQEALLRALLRNPTRRLSTRTPFPLPVGNGTTCWTGSARDVSPSPRILLVELSPSQWEDGGRLLSV